MTHHAHCPFIFTLIAWGLNYEELQYNICGNHNGKGVHKPYGMFLHYALCSVSGWHVLVTGWLELLLIPVPNVTNLSSVAVELVKSDARVCKATRRTFGSHRGGQVDVGHRPSCEYKGNKFP